MKFAAAHRPVFTSLILMAACTGSSPTKDGTDRLRNALRAQVGGLGGCTAIDLIDTVRQPHFDELTFMEGRCELEHGDTAVALVAVDSSGQLFLLDNPSSFAFMALMHRPSPVDSAAAVAYGNAALRMMGKVRVQDQLVLATSSISDSVLARLKLSRQELPPGSQVLQRMKHGYRVIITTLGVRGLRANELIVYSGSGEVQLLEGQDWPFIN